MSFLNGQKYVSYKSFFLIILALIPLLFGAIKFALSSTSSQLDLKISYFKEDLQEIKDRLVRIEDYVKK